MEPGESFGAERRDQTGGLGAKTRRGGRKRRTNERGGATSLGEGEAVEFRLPVIETAGGAGSGVGAGAGGPVFAPCR